MVAIIHLKEYNITIPNINKRGIDNMRRKKLILERHRKEYNQKFVADYLSVSQSRYSKIESGYGNPTDEQKDLLFKLLKVKL